MILGVIIELIVGAVCIIPGLLLWKKQKLSLLHDYHYKHVKREDVPAYARQMGLGLILIGAGIVLTGLLELTGTALWWVPLAAGFVAGLVVICRAQKKFNGSIMD